MQRFQRIHSLFDIQHGKAIPQLRNRQTILPMAIVSLLFFTWGLAYGLLDVMNYHVRKNMNITREQAAGLAAGYYLAYIPGALLIGSTVVTRLGYRHAFSLGLLGVAVGCILMSIAANHRSLCGMIGSHFVVGLGVSVLERSANPYATNCGPRNQAALRILIGQAWAGIGTVVAPFLANAFVFDPDAAISQPQPDPLHPGKCLEQSPAAELTHGDLSSVIFFYRGLAAVIAAVTVALTVVLFRTRWVPEVRQPRSPTTTHGWKLHCHPLLNFRYARLWYAVFANFINLGCQVTFAQFFIEHMRVNACANNQMAAKYMSIAQALFVVGRFVAAGLVLKPDLFKPRYVLAAFLSGAVVTCAAGTVSLGALAIGMASLVMFFEAPSFPMIFESGTADFEEWTPTAETLVILSISGGALQPALMGKLVGYVDISKAWWLTTAAFALVLTYPVACNVIPSFRKALDAADSEIGKSESLDSGAIP